MYRGSGRFQIPEAMTTEHIGQVRAAFVTAARLARDAGFDGVEIHGANGYLLDAFLTDYMNPAPTTTGASVANRVRLATEVCGDVAAAVGADIAVGIRISQGKVSDNYHRWAGGEDDAAAIFTALSDTGIDYIHTTEYRLWHRLSTRPAQRWRSLRNNTAGCRSSPTATSMTPAMLPRSSTLAPPMSSPWLNPRSPTGIGRAACEPGNRSRLTCPPICWGPSRPSKTGKLADRRTCPAGTSETVTAIIESVAGVQNRRMKGSPWAWDSR